MSMVTLLPWTPAPGQDMEQGQIDDPVNALYAKAMKAMMGGDIATAQTLAREMSTLALKLHGKDSPEYHMAMGTMTMVSGMLGDSSAATKLFAASGMAEEGGSPLTQGNFLGRVDMLRAQGQVDEAIALLRSVEPRLQTDDDKTTFQLRMGDLLAAKQDFAGAAAAYDKAATIRFGAANPNTLGGLDILAKKALNLQRSGNADEAGKLFDDISTRVQAEYARQLQQSQRLYPKGQEPPDIVARAMRAAEMSYAPIAAEFEAAGRAAQVASWRQHERQASDVMLSAVAPVYKAVNGLGLVENLLAQPGKEAEALSEARALAASVRSFGQAGLQSRASLRGENMQRDGAATLFITLADADYAFARARPAEAPSARAEALGALQTANNGSASRALLSAAADKQAGPQGVQRRTQAAQWDQLQSQIDAAFAAGDGQSADRLVKAQAKIDAQLEDLDRQIARQAPDYYAIVDPAPMSQAEVQSMLRPDEAVLLIVPGPRGTQVMAVTSQDVAWQKATIDEQGLSNAVAALRRSLDPRFRPAAPGAGWAFDRQDAFRLYQALFAPIASTLAGKKQLFIVTSGALSQLPLGVLVTQAPKGSDADPAALRGTAWLADAFALSQLPSLQSLKSLRHRAATARPPRRALLGFGDPNLGGKATLRGGPDDVRGIALETLLMPTADAGASRLANVELLRRMARLPGTASELERLRDLVGPGETRLFLQADATETAVKHSDLSDLHVLAFATHGLLGGVAGPDDPGLVLTPPRRASEQDDGLLTASEIVTLNLGVDWAILSACDTATDEGGVAASGLAQAFLAAGAETLLVSHWPVFDAVAGNLTTGMFTAMRADPQLTRAKALQRAMRDVRTTRDHPEFAHPAYWAPFALVGDGARQ